ncbi:MAG: S8 family serine peptidase [Candidatus Carbobacillus altaicus]|uniref:Serine alkaline protease (Subtilisin E) n=1 Tax=Candidatus Carbonibacillus altaicus TaxID=2163959 RepID=A0A2R6Y0J0_9BACL|nr:S8 family serine peptidase [Candidatus Carbobacillus altaicus]PTQ56165.1 MAG: serine alkaline protease (subtilisin E) [Candidatus Carbobacillus altaicus]
MDIINMSLGSPYYSSIIEQYVNLAYYNYDMLLVAAAGNSGNSRGTGDSVEYPARFPAVMAVAAIDSNNQRAYFSSTGKKVELSAPGVNVLSTIPGQSYAYYSGTSMASPHVAGAAALVWSAKPYLSNVELRQLLDSTALYLGKQEHYGYGLVQPWAAINR